MILHMEKDNLLSHIANDMLNGLNIHQIVGILRQFAIDKAEAYYNNLSEEQIADLASRFEEDEKMMQEAQKEAPAAEGASS